MGGRKKKVQVIKSRGEVTAQGMTIKEWQRTPKQLLNEFCQNQKRPKPIFKKAPCRDPDQFRTRVVLRDPKGKSEKDIVLCTVEGYPDVTASQHASALLALKQVDGARQHEKRLPEPFRTAWLAMGGGGDTNDDTKGGVESKRAKKAREAAEKDAAATSFDCRFCDKTFKKEHAVAIHLKQMHAAEIAAEQKAQEEEEEALAAQLAGGGESGAKTGGSGSSSAKASRAATAATVAAAARAGRREGRSRARSRGRRRSRRRSRRGSRGSRGRKFIDFIAAAAAATAARSPRQAAAAEPAPLPRDARAQEVGSAPPPRRRARARPPSPCRRAASGRRPGRASPSSSSSSSTTRRWTRSLLTVVETYEVRDEVEKQKVLIVEEKRQEGPDKVACSS